MLIKVTSGTAKNYTIGQLRKDNPNTSFPKNISDSLLAEYDVYKAYATVAPSHNELTHKAVSSGYEQLDGAWYQTWQAVELNDEEKSMALAGLISTYERAVERHMDDKVAERGYSSIVSACSYAGAPNPFQDEGIACLTWRGNVWAKCYQVLGDFQAGNRTKPTVDELISELPVLVW